MGDPFALLNLIYKVSTDYVSRVRFLQGVQIRPVSVDHGSYPCSESGSLPSAIMTDKVDDSCEKLQTLQVIVCYTRHQRKRRVENEGSINRVRHTNNCLNSPVVHHLRRCLQMFADAAII